MAIQLEDNKTPDIFEHPAFTEKKRLEEQQEELHLAAEHRLVKVQAFIRDDDKAEKKTKTAERVEKFREKQKAANLVQVAIPQEVAEAVKKTDGGFPAWLAAQKPAPAELTNDQKRLISKGMAVESLTGWRRLLIKRVTGL